MARQERDKPGVDASTAAFLTWFVPGAGHLLLGQTGLALAAFGLIEGLYWVGLQLSDGMTFQFLDHELRSAAAPALAPEVANLGGYLYQWRTFGYGPSQGGPQPFPDTVVLGTILTALSGVLNACLMAHAHLSARRSASSAAVDGAGSAARTPPERRNPALAMLLTWAVPGLGHAWQGRARRGLIVFVSLVGLFALGTWLAEGSNLSRERHYYYWSGQFLIGLPALVAEWIWGDMRIKHAIELVDPGLVFGCVAGLLNILAMIDVFDFGEAKLMGWSPRKLQAKQSEGA